MSVHLLVRQLQETIALGDSVMMLDEFRDLLHLFAEGRMADAEFNARLTEVLVNEAPELALPGGPLDESAAESLLTDLIFHFEQPDLTGAALRHEAAAVAAALAALPARATLAALPLFWRRERMAEIIEKYQKSIISRTGFVAAVGAASLGDRTSQWILSADATALAQLAGCLRRVDLVALHQLTDRAAA
jgi:hypothetical protein